MRNIPILGVHKIWDYDCSSNFVSSTSIYIRQLESEVKISIATSYGMYEMDNEYEEWLGDLNIINVGDEGLQLSQVSEETSNKIMDLLEKVSFTQQCDLLNIDEVANFCWDIVLVEVVKGIHVERKEKRWRKGMDLAPHFKVMDGYIWK